MATKEVQSEPVQVDVKEPSAQPRNDDSLGLSKAVETKAAVDGKSTLFAERARRAADTAREAVAEKRQVAEPESASVSSEERQSSNLESLKQYAALLDKNAGKVSLGASAASNPFRISYKLESNAESPAKSGAKGELELLRSLEQDVDRSAWGKLDSLSTASAGKAADASAAGLLDGSSKMMAAHDFTRASRMDSRVDTLRQGETQQGVLLERRRLRDHGDGSRWRRGCKACCGPIPGTAARSP